MGEGSLSASVFFSSAHSNKGENRRWPAVVLKRVEKKEGGGEVGGEGVGGREKGGRPEKNGDSPILATPPKASAPSSVPFSVPECCDSSPLH